MVDEGTAPTQFTRPTARKIEILQLVARGYTSREIGQILEISPKTVEKHVASVCEQVRARNKTHMVAIAVALGWVSAAMVLSTEHDRSQNEAAAD